MARFELKLPKMGESVAEATITSWLKEVGDTIALDEAIVEIATDKVDSEVPSEVEGTLVEVLFEKDEVVTVGATIAIIETAVTAEMDAATQKAPVQGAAVEKTIEKAIEDVAATIHKIDENGKVYAPFDQNIAQPEGITIAEWEQR